MKKMVVSLALACFAVQAWAAVVIVGLEPKSSPPELKRCEALIAGKVELGTDPTGGAKNTAFNDLLDPVGSTLIFTMDDSTVPATICTEDNVGDAWSAAICNQKNLAAINREVVRAGGTDEDPDYWFKFQCVKQSRQQRRSLWLVVECP